MEGKAELSGGMVEMAVPDVLYAMGEGLPRTPKKRKSSSTKLKTRKKIRSYTGSTE